MYICVSACVHTCVSVSLHVMYVWFCACVFLCVSVRVCAIDNSPACEEGKPSRSNTIADFSPYEYRNALKCQSNTTEHTVLHCYGFFWWRTSRSTNQRLANWKFSSRLFFSFFLFLIILSVQLYAFFSVYYILFIGL